MHKSVLTTDEDSLKEDIDSDNYCLGNLDLLNLRLNIPSDENVRKNKGGGDDYTLNRFGSTSKFCHPFKKLEANHSLTPNISKLPKGYGKSINSSNVSSENIVCIFSNERSSCMRPPERITTDEFLYPSKRKTKKHVIDVYSDDREQKSSVFQNYERNINNRTESRSFPFQTTPSGNFKIESKQVVFESEKISVLVADPENTRVNIKPEVIMSHTDGVPKNSAMDTIMSQGGLSTLGSLIGSTPVRSMNKESSEYESKRTSEILDPELNLGRLGYCNIDSINWDKVLLPEKKNLYLELYSRITNYTNADCKIYIDNEEFNCHLIVLQCYSELFDAYTAVKKVELPSDKCSASAFAFIYEWMITGEPSYKELQRDNVLEIFLSAKYLKIKDLVEQCWAFIDNADVFAEDTAFLLYMNAKRKTVPEVKELMLPRIQKFFLMLVSSQDWLELEIEDVKNLLASNYICVNCEMEVFMSAVRWLKHDWETRDPFKYEILECVRFGNIAPWQLVDIKRNPENPDFMELASDQSICKMIDDGLAYVIIKYWYGQENDDFQHWNSVLGLHEPPPRNWSGADKTYFTYREFLIYLDQYRRNQLLEKNKPKPIDKRMTVDLHHVPDNRSKENVHITSTMDEFLSKKKSVSKKKINKIIS